MMLLKEFNMVINNNTFGVIALLILPALAKGIKKIKVKI